MNAKIIRLQRAGGDLMDEPRVEEEVKFNRFEWMAAWMEAALQTPTIAVLAVLFKHMDSKGRAWPAVETVARMAGCSRRTAIKHINVAADAGWIEKRSQKGCSNVYIACLKTPENDAEPVQQMHGTRAGAAPPRAADARVPVQQMHPPVQQMHPPVQLMHERGAGAAPKQSIEQSNEQRSSSHPSERETQSFENQKPNPNDHDLVRFILETLADYDIHISIGECDKIAARLILSELDEADRRRYLLDWVPRLREKIDNGAAQRKVLHWLGGAKSIGWWQADVRSARRPAGGGETEDEAWAREQSLQANSYSSMDELMNAIALGGQK